MNAYLARLASNKELVGLFFGPSVDVLVDQIDECTDPYECEYTKLPTGGIYLSQAGAPRIPTVERYPEDDSTDWFAGATISELWIHVFYDKARWQPLEPRS